MGFDSISEEIVHDIAQLQDRIESDLAVMEEELLKVAWKFGTNLSEGRNKVKVKRYFEIIVKISDALTNWRKKYDETY